MLRRSPALLLCVPLLLTTPLRDPAEAGGEPRADAPGASIPLDQRAQGASARFAGSAAAVAEGELGRIVRHLDAGRWKKAEKAAAQAADEAARTLWSRAEAASLLAELALYRAVAEINLGRQREAVWHWQIALELWPTIAERPLEPWGEAVRLTEHPLRRAGEMPPGISPVDDLDLLRLEPATLDYVDGPTVDNPTAARRGPHGEIRVEMVVDRDGVLGSPRVLSEAAHPILLHEMLDWLAGLPPAEPARLDGEPVDALLTVAIDFDASWSRGGLFFVPEDGR